jgi:hypothetical protein
MRISSYILMFVFFSYAQSKIACITFFLSKKSNQKCFSAVRQPSRISDAGGAPNPFWVTEERSASLLVRFGQCQNEHSDETKRSQ